ncbi:lectin like domain-containing protein [Halobacteriovorax marinus]|uniref:lectin like domain-containing protein n=1 Tax=Halobacteriovorax marinus TaxID=97084 RepID=UPI003A8F1A18
MKKFIFLVAFTLALLSYFLIESQSYKLKIEDYPNVTSIKKQKWGTCWAFSTIAALESNILISKLSHTTDLSEYHLDKYNGFNRNGRIDDPSDDWFTTQGEGFQGSNLDNPNEGVMVHLGGDYTVSAAYLSGTMGAVEESKTPSLSSLTPIEDFGNTSNSGILFKNNYTYVYPQKILWLTKDGTDLEKRNRIKDAINKYGAVASAQFMEETPYKIIDNTEVHLNLTSKEPNHAITIVGWRDDIKINNQMGAWVVKDSDHIDEKTGEKVGLFYIPYSDLITGKDENLGGVIFTDIKVRDENTNIYNHALHGWQYDFKNKQEIKNIYQIRSKERMQAVGVYAVNKNEDIEIDLVINNKKIESIKYTTTYPGFYYIPVKQIDLNNGDKVEIIQKNKSNTYALDSSFWLKILLTGEENKLRPQWVDSKASMNQSFYMKDQKWHDLTKKTNNSSQVLFKNANFPIILYTITYDK